MFYLRLLSVFVLCTTLILEASAVRADKCPDAKNGDEDGVVEEHPDHFTFESWVKEGEDGNGKKNFDFGRCIENRGNGSLWTHWRGILAKGWTPVDGRRFAKTERYSSKKDPKDKELWYGDSRNGMKTVETECWKNEKKCKSPDKSELLSHIHKVQFTTEQMNKLSENDLIKILREDFVSVTTSTYEELYVPLVRDNPQNSLVRLSVTLRSIVEAGDLYYYLLLEFRNFDPRMNPFIESDNNPLIVIEFTDPWLQDALGEARLEVGGTTLRKVLDVGGRAPILEGQINVRNKPVVFDTTSIKMTDVTGEPFDVLVSLYRPN